MKIPAHLNCLLKLEKVFRVSSALSICIYCLPIRICRTSNKGEFRIKECFSVELTNRTVEPLTFVRFSASPEIGSLSRGLSAPVVFDVVMKR